MEIKIINGRAEIFPDATDLRAHDDLRAHFDNVLPFYFRLKKDGIPHGRAWAIAQNQQEKNLLN